MNIQSSISNLPLGGGSGGSSSITPQIVLVIGATGNVGRCVLNALLEFNKQDAGGRSICVRPRFIIRLVVRNIERARQLLRLDFEEEEEGESEGRGRRGKMIEAAMKWIELVEGDVLQRDSLKKAMEGVDFVICSIGSGQIRFWLLDYWPISLLSASSSSFSSASFSSPSRSSSASSQFPPSSFGSPLRSPSSSSSSFVTSYPLNHPSQIDYAGVLNVVEAARGSSTVKHLVVVSSLSVTRPWYPIALLLNSLISCVLSWKVKLVISRTFLLSFLLFLLLLVLIHSPSSSSFFLILS
jgi:hypothetical protein